MGATLKILSDGEPRCNAHLYRWDGEYEGFCDLIKDHPGPHDDGLTTWETDEDGTPIEGTMT